MFKFYHTSKKNIFKTSLLEATYWTKDELHPYFWDEDMKFKEDIRQKLLEIAEEFYDSTELGADIEDIQLTGSLANYNYTKHSDLDVHVLINFKDVNDDVDLVKAAADGRRFVWNERHDIIIGDHEVELYIQDTEEPHHRNGLYSLLNDEWVAEPRKDEPDTSPLEVKKKSKTFVDDIRVLRKELNDEDAEGAKAIYNRAKALRKKISTMRKEALKGGEGLFSVENLTFKELRNNGCIGELIDLTNDAYDKMYAE